MTRLLIGRRTAEHWGLFSDKKSYIQQILSTMRKDYFKRAGTAYHFNEKYAFYPSNLRVEQFNTWV